MMSGSKIPDFDACGLLRATHSHNPTQYSHIVGLSSHFYAQENNRGHFLKRRECTLLFFMPKMRKSLDFRR
ncbi:hypothetical protein [[Ruminococcus] lactaris]|uniref:hypothetical protein n=1 Tax=[Ruminococcus] lactaris TaxID=46228 RepID=UPI00242AC570|nr:hypothetical protein [[Ruminococcus] lactaris]